IGGGGGGLGGGFGGGGLALRRDEVRVVREEAIGMYAMAVLEAGSAAALQKWMTSHGYVYPKGMDAVCEDYVKKGWCFVAGKNRVGPKAAVEPRPGMKKVDAKLPAGSKFDGHVQAMAFRFPSAKLEIPMRLSAFNAGPHRNVVYLLSDQPVKLRNMPESFVKRQISGEQFYRQLTRPLPVRLGVGAQPEQISKEQWADIRRQRDPEPVLAVAREVFATDLLAVREKRLLHPHEEDEKKLLAVCTRLDLRGTEIDAAMRSALAVERRAVVRAAVAELKTMTMTVLDGDFSVKVMARENLTAAPFAMDPTRNFPNEYDAKSDGPSRPPDGRLIAEAEFVRLETGSSAAASGGPQPPASPRRPAWPALAALAGAALAASSLARHGALRWAPAGAAIIGMFLAAAAPAIQATKGAANVADKFAAFDAAAGAEQAADAIIKEGARHSRDLGVEALAGSTLARRGWAIVCLGELGDAASRRRLDEIATDAREIHLVRFWALAARLRFPGAWAQIIEWDTAASLGASSNFWFAPLAPAFGRNLAADPNHGGKPESLLRLAQNRPWLNESLAPSILRLGAAPLVKAMLTETNDEVRRLAAGFLGGLAQTEPRKTGDAVVAALKFNNGGPPPWGTGAQFLPTVAWTTEQATALNDALYEWREWCIGRSRHSDVQKIENLGLPLAPRKTPAPAPPANKSAVKKKKAVDEDL
ncbi:MAG TPA: DUF2330 domain-containing protein, partial [Planctomycetia bacterium]|nr:DUF2330 domain-containing protein [Planctomycetia bacterium]